MTLILWSGSSFLLVFLPTHFVYILYPWKRRMKLGIIEQWWERHFVGWCCKSEQFDRCTHFLLRRRDRHGVRNSQSRLADFGHSLPARLQERVAGTGPGEEAMDEGLYLPHGQKVKAGRTPATGATVRLGASELVSQPESVSRPTVCLLC